MQLVVGSLPPIVWLPPTGKLQQRYRLSPATVQRMLAELARRGLVVTRPGSGTYTAPRRIATAPIDVSWQTLAIGSRASLGADLEQMIQPGPADSISMSSGFLDEGLQPIGLLGAAAARAARRPQTWAAYPPRACPNCARCSRPRPAPRSPPRTC